MCLPQMLSALFIETRSLTEPRAQWIRQQYTVNPEIHSCVAVVGLQACVPCMPDFYMYAMYPMYALLNSDSLASILPTELPPRLQF